MLAQEDKHMRSSAYENLFRSLKKQNAKACIISSMRGTPIAWYGLEKKKIDVFSALSATVYGASSVLHREAGLPVPDTTLSYSKDFFLLIRSLDDGNVLAVLAEGDHEKLSRKVDMAIKECRGVAL